MPTFDPTKSTHPIPAGMSHRYVPGMTTFKDRPVVDKDIEKKTLTVCETFDRKLLVNCQSCSEFTMCPVFRSTER